ncbi:hypothetical protein PPIS_b0456 [Pseudoalteromonas piscicida]|uniref:Uncharacterized protein n=1 Tax=Pseudoalteromonas piscicida TaxID=43662 RepID=A0ABM6NLA2_PSEO7|nr:hypothetical protein PPIS_b0456 [Pseudoalteromonas piscicida]
MAKSSLRLLIVIIIIWEQQSIQLVYLVLPIKITHQELFNFSNRTFIRKLDQQGAGSF